MTIKEVEQFLDIPRATVRFYEKEGLIAPSRKGNGYRDYSNDDVDKLKRIIILRKLGIPVSDIEGLFEGTKQMPEVLNRNIQNIQAQMKELEGALLVTRRMINDNVELASFDSSKYWNVIEEEEKKGHRFMTIAKDIAHVEFGVISSYFSWTDCNGKPYISLLALLRNMIIGLGLVGCLFCLLDHEWNFKKFFHGVSSMLGIIFLDMVFSLITYFLGRKYPCILKHRKKANFILAVILLVVLIVLTGMA